jgi:hypothetical protein
MSAEQQSSYGTFPMVFSDQLDFFDDISCFEYIVQFGKQHGVAIVKARSKKAVKGWQLDCAKGIFSLLP